MQDRVLENIYRHRLIEKGDRVLLGLSGGPDSVFLFHILKDLREKLGFSLYLAHVNHGVRGEEALKDQLFVEGLAEQYNIPFYLKLADMDGYAREHNLSSEEAGREIRYGFFNEILEGLGGGKIAVGHNKSDQVETLLMRFFRGTGLDGLRGMDYRSGNIIRPMLNIEREALEAYLEERGLVSVVDKTNLETVYNRNKIRLETIPHIEKNYNPNLIETIFRSSDNFKEDSDFLSSYSQERFETMSQVEARRIRLDRNKFLKEHRSIGSRIIRLAIEGVKGDLQGLTQQHIIDSLDFIDRGRTGRSIDLVGGIKLSINYGEIVIGLGLGEARGEFSYKLAQGINKLDGLGLEVELDILDIDKFKTFGQNQYIKYFDYDKISSDLQIRNRRNGDIFKPLGMGGRKKKLKDFFIDEKIPREERDRTLILADKEDIIWIVGQRVSEPHRITEDTKRVVEVKISRRI